MIPVQIEFARAQTLDVGLRRYRLGNLAFTSELEFPELLEVPQDSGTPDVTIVRRAIKGPMPERDRLRLVRFARDRAYFAWQEIGRFEVTGGTQIIVDMLPDCDPVAMQLAFIGPVLAALIAQRGQLVLHAAAFVRTDGRAVLVAGDNGAGKSTFAAACAAAGLGILNDDVAAISCEQDHCWALAGVPTIKLSRTALSQFSCLPGHRLPGAPENAAKLRYRLTAGAPERAAIAQILILTRGDSRGKTFLAPSTGLEAILRYNYLLKFGADAVAGDIGARIFSQSATLANRVKVGHFCVRDDLARLHEAVGDVD